MISMNVHFVTGVNIVDDSGESYIWKHIVIKTTDGDVRLTLFPKDQDKMFEVTEGEAE